MAFTCSLLFCDLLFLLFWLPYITLFESGKRKRKNEAFFCKVESALVFDQKARMFFYLLAFCFTSLDVAKLGMLFFVAIRAFFFQMMHEYLAKF